MLKWFCTVVWQLALNDPAPVEGLYTARHPERDSKTVLQQRHRRLQRLGGSNFVIFRLHYIP